ncbi:MAG: hypothetical protein LC798_15395 [Chloroflexi bacterium]|nr:hypothetical protein [Chloroflexota bacterium]
MDRFRLALRPSPRERTGLAIRPERHPPQRQRLAKPARPTAARAARGPPMVAAADLGADRAFMLRKRLGYLHDDLYSPDHER